MPSKNAIYFGSTPTGKRIHLGDESRVWRPEDKDVFVVDTFCGAIMRAWEDGSMPPSSQVQEFCRNCFRSLAWEIFERSLMRNKRKERVHAAA